MLVSLLWTSAHAQGTVTPDAIEHTLDPGGCATEMISVALDEAPLPRLDVVLLIDVTSSMTDVIEEVTEDALQIVSDVRSVSPDTAFALATFADYPNAGGASRDYPWRANQDLTLDESLIQSALENVTLSGGGDTAESYLRALSETGSLSWRDGSRRIVILFGDAYPHDPDPGPDATLGTSDDLTQSDVMMQLAEANIAVLSIYASSSYADFYQEVADATGGQYFSLSRADQVPTAVQEMVEATVALIRELTLDPSSPGTGWVTWTPISYSDVEPLETRDFDAIICVPDGTTAGDHTFAIDVTGDGAEIGEIPVTIHVSVMPTSAPADPLPDVPPVGPFGLNFEWWWWLIPLLLLLLLLLALLLLRGRRGPSGPPARPGAREGVYSRDRRSPKSPSEREGASITHGRSGPKRRE